MVQIAKLPNHQITKSPNCPITKLPNHQIAKLPNCQIAKSQNHQIAKSPNLHIRFDFIDLWIHESQLTPIPGSWTGMSIVPIFVNFSLRNHQMLQSYNRGM
jgi:hypothetical protein